MIMMRHLAPDLVSLFLEHGDYIGAYIQESEASPGGLMHFSWHLANGESIEFGKVDFQEFLKYKDLYTSPLYKALT